MRALIFSFDSSTFNNRPTLNKKVFKLSGKKNN